MKIQYKITIGVLSFWMLFVFAGISYAAKAQPRSGVSGALAFLRGQIKASGLVDSYIEDNTDYAYTYDSALAVMAFVSSGDLNSARRVLDSFLAIGPSAEGGFYHRYSATSGSPVEGIVGVGHNAYLLQAINLYYADTQDAKYNTLAQRLADYMLTQQDADGGIFGRAGVTWKSTENNLAAFTAVNNFGVTQGLPYYTERAGLIRNFLITQCWDGTRFLCGKNDPMIVTDTQALGAIILGPAYKNGAYWIKNYTLNSKRYASRKTVTGFDENTDKDTVWAEGTLQEAIAYMVAGDTANFVYFKTEAEKLYQSSTGALLTASNAGTTGFDWTLQRWQAAAPTAWYIIACNQDNVFAPLQ